MKASTCAVVTSGVAALSVGAVVVATSTPPASMRTAEVLRAVDFAADSLPLTHGAPVEPTSDEDLDSALAVIDQLAPVTDGRVITVRMSGDEHPRIVTVAPATPNAAAQTDADLADGDAEAIPVLEMLDPPVALNEASDLIDDVYSFTRYWANYVSLELGPWLLDWVPLGYLLSDQIYIWYPDFVLPTVDSFVYDFLDPVVNDPFNLEVWFEGIGDVINTAATGLAEGVRDEIDYIVTFGWIPWPLPPLPGVAAASTVDEEALTSAESGAEERAAEATEDSGTDGTEEAATEEVAIEPVDTEPTDGATEVPSPEASVEGVGETPADESLEDDSEAPVEPIDEPVDEPVDEVADDPIDEPAEMNDEVLEAEQDAAEGESDDNHETTDVDQSGNEDTSTGSEQAGGSDSDESPSDDGNGSDDGSGSDV